MKHRHFAQLLFSAICLLACETSQPSRPTTNSLTTSVATGSATASIPPSTAPTGLAVELVSSGACDGAAPAGEDSNVSLTAERTGRDVKLTVKDVPGYCKTVASYSARLDGDTVHLTRAKPTAVSRCVCAHDLIVVVHDVPDGASKIVYEEEPYASDSGVGTIASGSIR